MTALRHPRCLAALASVAFLGVMRVALPDGDARASLQYALVITLGYGHLLAAALPAWRSAPGAGALRALALATTGTTGLALYGEVVARWPALVLGLALASLWHIAENDAAMAQALRTGGGLPRLAGRARMLPLLATALGLGAALWALPDAGRFGDVFSGVTLYHLLAWLGFARLRGARLARLAALHAGPALLCGALWLAPESGPGALRALVLSPGVYLFWSALHVLGTARRRAVP